MTTTIDITPILAHMRSSGRTELVHYAGAAHRDQVAWHMTAQWLDAPFASEAVLKARALRAAGWPVAEIA